MKYFILILILLPWEKKILTPEEQSRDIENRLASLISLEKTMEWNTQQIKELQQTQQAGSATSFQKKDNEKALFEYEKKQQELEDLFFTTAFGMPASTFLIRDTFEKIEKRDLVQEIQQLVAPLIDAVTRMSERPRKIESIRKQIEILTKQLNHVQEALVLVGKIEEKDSKNQIKTSINKARHQLESKEREYSLFLESSQRELDTMLVHEQPIVSQIKEVAIVFVKTKGLNLILGVVAFFFAWVIVGWARIRILDRQSFVDVEKNAWLKRPINALFHVIAFIVSILSLLVVLYVRHDWFLVTIIIIFLFSLGWSLKQYAPRFIGIAKLILNLGTVKEGELVIWNQLPWIVESLNFTCTLKNPYLSGGIQKVAAKDLMNLQSRPLYPNERIFPTNVNDFVLIYLGIQDGDKGQLAPYGCIEHQTPERIVLNSNLGLMNVPTKAFLGMYVVNLSSGFNIEIIVKRPAQENMDKDALIQLYKNTFPSSQETTVRIKFIEIDIITYSIISRFPGNLANQWASLIDEMNSLFLKYINKTREKE